MMPHPARGRSSELGLLAAGESPCTTGEIPYLTARRVVAPYEGQESGARATGGGGKPPHYGGDTMPGGAPRSSRPTGPSRPGGGEFNEEVKGYDVFSGSGARGTAGRFEGAAGQ